jgi:hypothetical protein
MAASADCDVDDDARAIVGCARHFARRSATRDYLQPPRTHAKRVRNLLYLRRISQRRDVFTRTDAAVHLIFFSATIFIFARRRRAFLEQCGKPAIYRCDVMG